MVTDTAWYVFGVVSSADAARLGLPALEADGLAALVAPVPLAEFGEDVLPERLNDRAWLEERARAHQEILQDVSASATVVPFRFGTIYREPTDVRTMLDERRDVLGASLDRVRGYVEIGVKAWAASADRGSEEPAESGSAYLRQRLDSLERSRSGSSVLADAAAGAHARLLRHAVEGVANRPQPPELTGRRERMILNGAYLVSAPEELHDEVAALSKSYAGLGITFELTGPWPPYNFVDEGDAP